MNGLSALLAGGLTGGIGGVGALAGVFGKSGKSPFGSLKGLNQSANAFAQLGGMNEADKQYQESLRLLQGLQTPGFQQYGDLNQLGEISDVGNAYNDTDSYSEDVQKDILGRLQNLATTGTTAQATLDRQNFTNNENTRTKGIRDAILQREAQSGRNGSGAGLLDQLTNGQNSALVGNQNALQTAANLENSRIQGMQGASQAGAQITNQQFQRAQAQNAINQFNQNNQLNRMYYNNDLGNESNTRRVDQSNAQAQQNYNNQIGKISGQVAQVNQMGANRNQGYSNAGNAYQSGNQFNQGLDFQKMQNEQKNQWGAFDRILGAAQGGANYMGSRGGSASGGGAQVLQRANGGPVPANSQVLVGEQGEELLVNDKGAHPIGVGGQEIIHPSEDGMVIPNHDLNNIKDFIGILTGKKRGYTLA